MTLHRVGKTGGASAAPDVRCPTCDAPTPPSDNCFACGSALSKTQRYPRGAQLGAYIVEDVLGEGGMGVVYLASHNKLGRRVAIKVLRSEYGDNPQAVRRFFAEARAVNKIAHEHIVEVTDFVEGADTAHDNYYVMELLEGASLAVLIDTGGVPGLARSVGIMTQLAEALAAVHRAGIVHRDLKPDNVVLIEKSGKTDFVKLCDFGVAKLTDASVDGVVMHRTSAGAILGTPEYMSPEQASGKSVDARADIYSFGVMLYELTTGRVPFKAPDFGEMVVQLLKAAPVPPSHFDDLPEPIPAALEELILQCLAKNPADRPQNMEQVGERLEQIAEHEGWLVYEIRVRAPTNSRRLSEPIMVPPAAVMRAPTEPAPAPQPRLMAHAPSRRRLAVIGVVACLLVGAALAAVMSRGSSQATPAHSKVDDELAVADRRIAAGRLVAPGGDEALDHLLAAKALDPQNPKVTQRLQLLASKFAQLADQAIAAGSLAEAAAHLQTVLLADPDNAAAAKKMADIEQQMLDKQRTAGPAAPASGR